MASWREIQDYYYKAKGLIRLQEAGLKAWSAIYLRWSTNNELHEMQ